MKVLITGASKGIGYFLLKKLVSEGYDVIGTYNSTIPPSEFEQYFSQVDVKDQHQINAWITNSVSKIDEIILINCAGANYNAFAHKADLEKWTNLIEVNLIGTFRIINSVLPIMREKGYGRIINFSSIVAQKGVPGTSAYAASKAALCGMTKSIAV